MPACTLTHTPIVLLVIEVAAGIGVAGGARIR